MINIQNLTQEFSNGKGIFDVSFDIQQGEVFGFLGPNGAGKSTTIRHLMGYMKPQKGKASVNGFDAWDEQSKARERVGYLPGEIAFLDDMSGMDFLKMMAGMQKGFDKKKRDDLIHLLQFDPKTPIRKMSKGMKQKVGIVATFMHDPDIYILDEPTSGLDPLMQKTFIDLVLEEKDKGKTFLMSSHSFAEIERTCDRAAIIRNGKIITVKDIHELQSMQRKVFDITLQNPEDVAAIQESSLLVEKTESNIIRIVIQGSYDEFFNELSKYQITNMSAANQSLEQIFMDYYNAEEAAK
ncbi:ABC transporter ATP-binding protein [Pseudalkalibacillus berkeleyi]|uniref:ABC transporter ATP-binding protein n=1 Tax=Pseudalkalibacillus berkeleyi TaxID=1069813 RepID=A0ABS9GXY0_9BACL|nr:ABC transporter ATP-binding protein [Pseudalkalibacillus berkeleyi]MCF6136484.1 ABC transporter ATP-binding protein [Pseudalkalibacillus berkeleyi]